MPEDPKRPIVDVTRRYLSARPATKKIWLALVVNRDGGLTLDDLATLCGEPAEVVRDAIVDINATDRAIVTQGSHYKPIGEITPEENAFFHEEWVQLLIQNGKDREAMDWLYKTAYLHQSLNDRIGQADDLGNIGALLLRSQQFSRARAIFEEALALHKQEHQLLGQARDLANLGVIAAYEGDLNAAEDCLTQAADLFAKGDAPEMVARAQQNLAEITRLKAQA